MEYLCDITHQVIFSYHFQNFKSKFERNQGAQHFLLEKKNYKFFYCMVVFDMNFSRGQQNLK